MSIDSTVEIDSPIYGDAEYQAGDELIVFFRDGLRYLIIHNVSEQEFLELQRDPTHEALTKLKKSHFSRLQYS